MRSARVVAALVLPITMAACGNDAGVTTTTTTTATTVADIAPDTTVEGDGAGTTAPREAPTTTVEATTTTTEAAPAHFGVVAGPEGVLGWWDGSSWVQAQDRVPIEGGEAFQVLRLGSETSTTRALGVDGGCELIEPSVGISFDPDPWSGRVYDPFVPLGVAVSAPWPVEPHAYTPFAPNDDYRAIASELLAERGVEDPDPGFAQLIRTDIGGDGVDEVFAVAERRSDPSGALNPAPAGDYSIAFVRAVIDEVVETFVLEEWIVVEQPEEGFIQDLVVSRFDALLDADGDGIDEVALRTSYYEGSGVALWDWQGPSAGFVEVIGTGCGA